MSAPATVYVALPQPGQSIGPTDYHSDPDCPMLRRWTTRWQNAGEALTYVATTERGLPAESKPAPCCGRAR